MAILLRLLVLRRLKELKIPFNLALGTMMQNGEIDFFTITNNGDRNKILMTVAWIVNIFLERNPGKSVYFTGSDERRTNLYNRSIAYGYEELIKMYHIYGDISLDQYVYEFHRFEKGKLYSGFLVKRK